MESFLCLNQRGLFTTLLRDVQWVKTSPVRLVQSRDERRILAFSLSAHPLLGTEHTSYLVAAFGAAFVCTSSLGAELGVAVIYHTGNDIFVLACESYLHQRGLFTNGFEIHSMSRPILATGGESGQTVDLRVGEHV